MNFWFRLPLKTRLGIISTLLMVLAIGSVVLATWDPLRHKPLNTILKIAPILFLLWLAWSDLKNLPLWVYLVAPPIIIFCSLKPSALFVVVPLGLFVLFILPKKKNKS